MFSPADFGKLTKMSTTEPNEPHAAPTLSAVAKLAGVSSITVSRVVRLPDLVAPQTRGRVEAAMRELGYVPNLVAGSLASSRTSSIGVLVPTIANSIFADTVQGLSDELEPRGYAVILAQSRYDAAREDRMLAALLSRRPEAIIMVGSPATEDGARLLRRAGIPVVETWDLPVTPIDAVAGFSNYAAGAAVARHLVAQGRQNLAFIGGDDPRATRRWLGFKEAASEAGAKCPRRLILDRDAPGGVDALAKAAWCRRRVRSQRRACHWLHFRPAKGRIAAYAFRRQSARRGGRSRRSGDGPADRTKPEHHSRSRRRHRAYRRKAYSDTHRAAPCRPWLRACAARQWLISIASSAGRLLHSPNSSFKKNGSRCVQLRKDAVPAAISTCRPSSSRHLSS